MPDPKYLHSNEFVEGGYLQEVNRLVLHPLGLALQASLRHDGHFIAKVWDCREDPEGVYFDGEVLSAEKAEKVCQELMERRDARVKALGYVVQPVPSTERTLTVNYRDPETPTIPQNGYEFEA